MVGKTIQAMRINLVSSAEDLAIDPYHNHIPALDHLAAPTVLDCVGLKPITTYLIAGILKRNTIISNGKFPVFVDRC